MKYTGFIIIIILLVSIIAYAELQDIRSSGKGTLVSGDIVKARAEAFDDALSNAVEKGIRGFLTDEQIAENMGLLKEKIFPKATGYIKSIEIIDEKTSKETPNIYEITTRAIVTIDNLQTDLTDLGLYKHDEYLPKILVLIQEKNIDDVHWHFQTKALNYTETAVREAMRLDRFRTMDQTDLLNDLTPDEERTFYTEDINTILNIGSRYGADVIISGKAISRASRDNNNLNGNVNIQASVNLEARQIKDGKLIASSSGMSELIENDESAGGELAILKAAKQAAADLIADLTSSRSQNVVSGMNIVLIVNGLKSIESLLLFQREFEDRIDGLRSIKRRTFSSGTAAYDLVSNSDGEAIADKLISRGLFSFKVKVRSKSQKSLELNLSLK